jgi:hypothetical protein
VEALELRWSGSERNKSDVIHCLCALCYTKELTGVCCAEAEEAKKEDKPLISCSWEGSLLVFGHFGGGIGECALFRSDR